jgi:hypothetical protein
VLNELGVDKWDHNRFKNPIWISPKGEAEASPTWPARYWDDHLNHEIMRQDPNITSVYDDPLFDDPNQQGWRDEWEDDDWNEEPGYDDRGMPNWVKDFGIK